MYPRSSHTQWGGIVRQADLASDLEPVLIDLALPQPRLLRLHFEGGLHWIPPAGPFVLGGQWLLEWGVNGQFTGVSSFAPSITRAAIAGASSAPELEVLADRLRVRWRGTSAAVAAGMVLAVAALA